MFVAHEHTFLKYGLMHLAIAHTACNKAARQGIDSLQAHTIHTHRGGEHCGVVLAARVEFRHSIYQGTKGYATAIVAYFGSEIVVYVHLNAFAKPLVKLVDTIVYTLLEQHIYTIFGMRAIAQATNVHAGTRTYVLGILKMSYFALVINDGRSILVLHCLVMFMADPLTC